MPYCTLLHAAGADVFKLGLLQSDTDYTVYAYGWGVPGVDMAYYAGRGFYHTTRDRYGG